MPSSDNNPLAKDAKLQQLLQDVTSIQSNDALASWRKSFIAVYQQYLDPDGVLNARDADQRLLIKLQALTKATLKVQSLIDNKNISTKQVTAEGYNGLNNLGEKMKEAETAINVFCPKTSQDEDTVGYDKFELGAVLIKDGFHAYEIMTSTKDYIQEFQTNDPIQSILQDNKNLNSIMEFYFRGVDSFIQIMEDLGLMGLAKQCVQVYKSEPRPQPSQPGPNGEPPEDDFSEFVGNGDTGEEPDKTITKIKPAGKDKKGKDKTKPGKKTKHIPPPSSSNSANNDKPNPEDKEDENKDDDDGDGGDGEFVLYWDPLTETFGKMPRDKIAPLIIEKKGNDDNDDDDDNIQNDMKGAYEGDEKNRGVIEDPDEKANLIWILKKLEKKKEKQAKNKGSWLDEIKKEKAAKRGGSTPKKSASTMTSMNNGKKKPMKAASEQRSGDGSSWGKNPLGAGGPSSPTKSSGKKKVRAPPSRTKSLPQKLKKGTSSSGGGSGSNSPTNMAGQGDARKVPGRSHSAKKATPKKKFLGAAPTSTTPPATTPEGTKKKRHSGFEDYQGKYKTTAPRPTSDGWASVSGKFKK